MKFVSYESNRIRIFRCSCVKNFRESYVFHCLVIKVLHLPSCDSSFILSHSQLFVKNFFNFFQSYLVAFQQQAYLYYHKLFRLSRIFSILFLCRFSRISLNSLSFSFSLAKNFFILFRHFSVVFQLVKIPFLNSVLNKRRRRDLNPRAATNDLLPFQGSPFGQLGYFSKSGEGGIRTHAPFRTNGFQDRLVMTTSIPLQDT